MKDRHIGFGIVLLAIGLLLLLINLGTISWSFFDTLLEFWPAIFIVIGINIIFRKYEIVRALTWVIFIAAIAAVTYFNGDRAFERGSQWKNDNNVKIEKAAETDSGEFSIKFGGTIMNINSTESNLLEASLPDLKIEHNINYSEGKKNASIVFKREKDFRFDDYHNRKCDFNLNDRVLWKLNVDTGAVSGTLDMSDLMVSDLDMDTGAAKLKLILGDKYKSTNVNIDAGASSFDIVVPKGSGIRIKVDGALNNTDMGNINFQKSGKYYISKNYDSAENKINIDVDMGVGNLNINAK